MQIEGKRLVRTTKKDKNKKPNDGQSELIEDYKGPVNPKPPTVEEVLKMGEEAKQEGYEQGYSEGLNKGMQEGQARGAQEGQKKAYNETKQELEDQNTRLKNICDSLFDPMQGQEQHIEAVIVDMAVQFAKQILDAEIQASPQYLFDIIHKALSALPVGAKNISVFLNEQDAILAQGQIPKQQRNWIIKVDNALQSGGCRVETLESLVDYTVETRLKQFLQQVQEKGDVGENQVEPISVAKESDADKDANGASDEWMAAVKRTFA